MAKHKPNGEIKIEKGVPLPHVRGVAKYPWHEMKVGDSFVVPAIPRTNFHQGAKQVGIQISTRVEGDSIRVWRIA